MDANKQIQTLMISLSREQARGDNLQMQLDIRNVVLKELCTIVGLDPDTTKMTTLVETIRTKLTPVPTPPASDQKA